jgi:hypothetical protein
MADVWSCSLDYSGVVITPNSGGNPDTNSYNYLIEFHAISQPLLDPLPPFNNTVDYGHYVVTIGIGSDGMASMGIQMQGDSSETGPLFWPGFFEAPNITGQPAALFTNGGTLTMTKDYDGDLFSATSPIGTISFTLSHLDPFLGPNPSYRNTLPLLPQGYGAQFTQAEPTFAFPAYAVLYETKFSNILAKRNGVTIQTFALSATNPGTFYPDNGLAFDGMETVFGVLAPYWTVTQEPTDQKITGQVTLADYGNYFIFTFWRSLTVVQSERILSSLCLQTNGSLLYARVLDSSPNAVEVAYSDTSGHVWNPFLQGQVMGRVYSSPSLSENPDGTVNLFVYDKSVLATRWLKSYDFGRTFSDFGLLLPALPWATSDHPKVMTLFNGFFLVSYNQSGHQHVGEFPGGSTAAIVSTDFGPTPGGLAVYPGMWQNDAGVAYVVSAPTGIEHERQSESWGTTWEDTYSRVSNRFQVVTVKDRRNNFAFMAFQDASGNLFVGFSDDGFLTFVTAPVAVPTVPAPLVNQYVGLTVLPDGTLIVIPQVFNSFDNSWHIQPLVSKDYGQTWVFA